MTRVLSAVVIACALVLAVSTAGAAPRCDNDGRCIGLAGHVAMASQGLSAGRPAGCPRAWCGCGLALKLFGRHVRELWLARAWLKFPRVSGPVPGSVAVLSRGRRGGHVGIVRGTDANGNPIIYSGNHNRRWGEAIYPRSRVIAYVMP